MIYALISTLLTAAMAVELSRRWRLHRRAHTGAWALSLWLGALASLAYAVHAAGGGVLWFRAYYLCGAVLAAPVLAAGSAYLGFGPRIGRVATGAVAVLAPVAAAGVLGAPVDAAALASLDGGSGRGVLDLSGLPLAAMIALNTLATLTVAGVAVRSAVRRRGPGVAPGGHLLIAAGVLLLGAAGGAARGLGQDAAFWPVMTAGWAVVYGGVRLAAAARTNPEGKGGA